MYTGELSHRIFVGKTVCMYIKESHHNYTGNLSLLSTKNSKAIIVVDEYAKNESNSRHAHLLYVFHQ